MEVIDVLIAALQDARDRAASNSNGPDAHLPGQHVEAVNHHGG